MNINFGTFEEHISVAFNDKRLLTRAFTHRSFVNENKEATEHNERLEFLGDAVLELVVTAFLFGKYPHKAEGELTAIRAALVNTTMLSKVASELNMDAYLLLSKGEAKDIGRARQYILANTVEAVIGAMYLDRGFDVARDFIEKNIVIQHVEEIVAKNLWQDSKSHFQEKAQDIVNTTPTYRTLGEDGPDHDKYFTVGVFLDEKQVAEGRGQSKQEAEQEAARMALEVRGWK